MIYAVLWNFFIFDISWARRISIDFRGLSTIHYRISSSKIRSVFFVAASEFLTSLEKSLHVVKITIFTSANYKYYSTLVIWYFRSPVVEGSQASPRVTKKIEWGLLCYPLALRGIASGSCRALGLDCVILGRHDRPMRESESLTGLSARVQIGDTNVNTIFDSVSFITIFFIS